MKDIVFTPLGELTNLFVPEPVRASSTIPDWYKKTDLTLDGRKLGMDPETPEGSNGTIKACTPFLDAMTMGYMAVLAADIEIKKTSDDGPPTIRWRVEPKLVDWHRNEQTYSMPRSNSNHFEVFKWIFDWHIQTPKGYSCLYTHPLNRDDLPFRTFTGVVDSDMYPESVHFPFMLKKQTEEITYLEKGTPVCQIIPFKRDEWKSSRGEYSPEKKRLGTYALMSKIQRSYKNQFWAKKKFL